VALRHADELGLSAAQRQQLESGRRDLEAAAQKFSEQARLESGVLAQLLAAETPDSSAIAAQFEKVLSAEDEVKRVRLKLSLHARAVLTPEQQKKLAVLSTSGGRARTPAPEQQELAARMERLKQLIERAKGQGRDLSAMREMWKRVGELTRNGKTVEANQVLEETAESLERSLAATPIPR
jgi:hypothetical protein